MKVYFIGNGYDGCYYVRCLLPLIYNGWDGEKTSIYGKKADSETMFRGAMASDIVVFQRPADIQKIKAAQLLKIAGKKIVFDNDDTYKPNSGIPTQAYDKNKKVLELFYQSLKTFLKKADLATTTTEYLANEYRKLNKNVVVLPNLIDPADWEKPLKNTSGKIRIGLVGSVLANNDFKPAIKALYRLSERSDVQLVILGLPKGVSKKSLLGKVYRPELKFWSGFKNIEWHKWVPQEEYNNKLNSLRLDIMLIPRDDSYFNQCKSNIKFLEASMCEVPVIAQGFPDHKSPYEVNKEDTKYEIIVSDNSKWLDKIDYLISHEKERKEMGEKAREYVIKNYNIQTKYNLWREAYKKIL